MTIAEITKDLTQIEYERLLSRIAGAMNTQRRFIEIISAEAINSNCKRYRVKRKGSYYHYLVDEIGVAPFGFVYVNKGLII